MIIKVISDCKITKNFALSEFVCKEGLGEVLIDMPSIQLLQRLRDQFGKPITVLSAYRSLKYNTKIGSLPTSQHIKGKAFDIQIKGETPEHVGDIASRMGFNGIGIYDTFTHVDTRTVKSKWDERTKE